MPLVSTPVSVGELIDKITILEIKAENIKDENKLKHINYELQLLNQEWETSEFVSADISNERQQLKKVNEKMWEIEDKIRLKEAAAEFDDEFIQLARSVYYTNDERANIKRQINTKLNSDMFEEKSYADYKRKDT